MGLFGRYNWKYGGLIMSKKEEQAYEYSKRVSRGNPMTKDLAECSFMVGWDACMKHLASLPWNEAVNEIVKHIETNRSENPNSSKLAEV